jgi:hypothetical protein
VVNALLRSEILQHTHAGTVNLEPRWLKVDAAVSYSGISRAVLYRILAEGKIRSSSLRSPGALRGIRLIDRASLDAYIESFATKCSGPKEGRAAV